MGAGQHKIANVTYRKLNLVRSRLIDIDGSYIRSGVEIDIIGVGTTRVASMDIWRLCR